MPDLQSPISPDNPIVELCLQGMQAEAQGRYADAQQLFARAWESSTDDFEACIAAHYLARQQETPQEMLHWNQTALDCAAAVGDERVRGFYPSLYLNLGFSYETLGDREAARSYYRLAADDLHTLPDTPYASTVRQAIANALDRLQS
jgi:tetratricopeptide (TPR) repeat protein